MNFNDLVFHSANHNLSSDEVEQVVLGTFISYPDTYFYHADKLSQDSFESKENKEIFKAIAECGNKSKIDIITIREMLLSKGLVHYYMNRPKPFDLLEYVTEMCNNVQNDDNISIHIELLCNYTKRRGLSGLGNNILQSISSMKEPDDIVHYISSQLVLIQQINDVDEFKLNTALSQLTSKIEGKDIVDGIKSYIFELDEFMSQFDYGFMVVIAGAPSMGKTAFALEIVKRNVMRGKPVMVFSLEMSETSLLGRMIASEGMISLKNMRNKCMTVDDWKEYHKTVGKFEDKHLFIDSQTKDLYKIGNKIKRYRIRYDVRLFVIDYMQLVNVDLGNKSTREQEIAKISRYFKLLAVELQAVIIPLSQISREHSKRENHRPKLSDLRESGAIEQDADMVIFPYREAYYDISNTPPEVEDVEIIIAKGREMGTGKVKVKFRSLYSKFYSANEENTYDEYIKSKKIETDSWSPQFGPSGGDEPAPF